MKRRPRIVKGRSVWCKKKKGEKGDHMKIERKGDREIEKERHGIPIDPTAVE